MCVFFCKKKQETAGSEEEKNIVQSTYLYSSNKLKHKHVIKVW